MWLCQPGLANNPCEVGLATTWVSPSGETLKVERPKAAKRPKIDCFYVYPTVSDDEGPNSDLEIDPEERSIALYQAARYSQHCRVFAPMYRQITLAALFSGEPVTPEMAELAYGDVLRAWKTYLKKYNRGRRGVVMIGHSQGTIVLRRLISEQIDSRPKVRDRLISALLFGGNVLVAKGERVGGDFDHIPGCQASEQTGCAIAFSAFNLGTVPENSLFGRPGSGNFGGDPATQDVLCTDPSHLRGGGDRADPLRLVAPSEPFAPGTTIGAATEAVGVPRPAVSTPWIELRGAYTGYCTSDDGANVLSVAELPGATRLNPVPDETWGLHLVDANIALGNLVDVVADQARAFTKRDG